MFWLTDSTVNLWLLYQRILLLSNNKCLCAICVYVIHLGSPLNIKQHGSYQLNLLCSASALFSDDILAAFCGYFGCLLSISQPHFLTYHTKSVLCIKW